MTKILSILLSLEGANRSNLGFASHTLLTALKPINPLDNLGGADK